MYQNRATFIETPAKAADHDASNNPTSQAGPSISRTDVNDTSVGSGLSKSDLVLQFWTFRPGFLAYIRRCVSNGCAEDIFQEACAKFLASNAVFVYPQAGTRYFLLILRSLIADHFKQSARLECSRSVPEGSWDPWPAAEQRQLAERVYEAVKQLSAEDRRSLSEYFGPDAAGSGPGRSRGNMRYRVRKAVRKVRAMVAEKQSSFRKHTPGNRSSWPCSLDFKAAS